MITIDNINSLYNKYNTLSNEADLCSDRNMNMLMMYALDSDHMDFDGDSIVFTKAPETVNSLEIERISGAEDLGRHMAVVTPTVVYFLDKKDGSVRLAFPSDACQE